MFNVLCRIMRCFCNLLVCKAFAISKLQNLSIPEVYHIVFNSRTHVFSVVVWHNNLQKRKYRHPSRERIEWRLNYLAALFDSRPFISRLPGSGVYLIRLSRSPEGGRRLIPNQWRKPQALGTSPDYGEAPVMRLIKYGSVVHLPGSGGL